MTDRIKEGISSFLNPVLISVVGVFAIYLLNNISERLERLEESEEQRKEWVRDWIEKNQSALDWAKKEMNK